MTVLVGMKIVDEGKDIVTRYLDTAELPTVRLSGRQIQGRAAVIDGDTIEISGQRIRFNGIDAPESAQRCQDSAERSYACGRASAMALDEFLAASRPVTCQFVEWDQYGRFVGNCARADGKSVSEWLVKNGHALDWPRYSGGAYTVHQAKAKKAKAGIWQGEFELPWEWRAQQHGKPDAPSVTVANPATGSPSFAFIGSQNCDIKGNISAKGERIYHVPGQKFYVQTKVSERKGERWFCSEAEAQQAGWRKARR